MIFGNVSTPLLTNHLRPAYLIPGGLLVSGAGYLIFTLVGSTSGPAVIIIATRVAMLGTGPLAALCNHLAMGAVPPDKAGSSLTRRFGDIDIAEEAADDAFATAVARWPVDGVPRATWRPAPTPTLCVPA